MLKTMLKRTALLLVLAFLAITASQSQSSAAFCTIERGLDPLDVLQTSVKHNVWIILDRSGSMGGPFDPGDSLSGVACPYNGSVDDNSRMCESVDVITELLDEFVDANGDPLVNWGYSHFVGNNRNPGGISWLGTNVSGGSEVGDGSGAEPHGFLDCSTGFCGGLVNDIIEPPACQGASNIASIENRLLNLNPFNNGFTPLGISLMQLANRINNDPDVNESGLYPGQKNFILFLTDGWDTCECRETFRNANNTLNGGTGKGTRTIRYDPFDPALTYNIGALPGAPTSTDCDSGGYPNNEADGQDDIDQAEIRLWNSGMKAEQAFKLLHGNTAPFDGSAGDIYIVGMGVQVDDCFTNPTIFENILNHMAWKASGVDLTAQGRNLADAHAALFADDRDQLKAALLDVLGRIAVPTTEVTLGSPIVGSVKELIPLADSTVNASDILASGVNDTPARVLRVKYRNNVLFTTSAELPGFKGHFRAHNIYTVVDPGLPTETRESDFTEIWDAGEMLQTRNLSADPRTIYFSRYTAPGTPPALLDFEEGTGDLLASDLGVSAGYLDHLDPTGVGAKTAADAAEIVERAIKGWQLIIRPTYGFYKNDGVTLNWDPTTSGNWKLFEAANAAPAVVLNPPRSPDADPPQPTVEYRDFYDEQINRLTTVYLSTGGGMMHAFRADNGYELYAYIPWDLLKTLPTFVDKVISETNGVTNHEYFIASSATVQDAYLKPAATGDDEWRTVLAFGRGRGGKFMTALDVSEVGDWDGTSPPMITGVCASCVPSDFVPPLPMWTVGNRDGLSDADGSGTTGFNYDGFGETWSLPAMGNVHSADPEGQWVVFMGSGYGCNGTNEGRYFYVLQLEDGLIYYKSPAIPDNVGGGDEGVNQNALVASPALLNPHEPGVNDGKDYVTRAYIGDLQGVVHKLDATDPDPDNWEFGVFFEVTDEADEDEAQGDYNQPITARIAILKLVGSDDIFLFVGTGGDTRVTPADGEPFKFVGIKDLDNANTILASDAAFKGDLMITDPGGDPFFFDLAAGERVFVAPVAARNTSTNGAVFLASSRYEFNAGLCSFTFASTLQAAGVTTGLGSFDLDPSTAGVQDSMDLGEGKVTGLYHRDEHLYVSKSGGVSTESETDVLGSDEFPQPIVSAGTIQVLVDGFRMSPF
jgi:hypothetical protein